MIFIASIALSLNVVIVITVLSSTAFGGMIRSAYSDSILPPVELIIAVVGWK